MGYVLCRFDAYDYTNLSYIKPIQRNSRSGAQIFNNIICMLDTETSKKDPEQIKETNIL